MPRPIVTAVLGLLLFVPGAIVPGMVAESSRPLANDANFTITTRPTQGTLWGEPVPIAAQRHTTTGASPVTGAVDFRNEVTVTAGNAAFTLTQSTLLNRESTYPMPAESEGWFMEQHVQTTTAAGTPGGATGLNDAAARSTVAGGVSEELGPFDGLTAFFPSRTDKRTYPYFDPIAQETIPIDYLGQEEFLGLDALVFYHEREGLPLRIITGLEQALDAALSSATYDIQRTVWVEPTTGHILSEREAIRLHSPTGSEGSAVSPTGDALTTGEEQAAGEAQGAPLLFEGELEWDEASQGRALERVAATVRWVTITAIGGWVLSALGVVLLVLAAWSYARNRAR